jgi:hypothetical protein
VPAEEGIGLDVHQGVTPGEQTTQKYHNQPSRIIGAVWLHLALLKQGELFAQEEVLGSECAAGPGNEHEEMDEIARYGRQRREALCQRSKDGAGHERPALHVTRRYATADWRLDEISAEHTYLKGLQWDGVERLDRWLSTYLGSDDTEYSRAVGSRWLISAVARIFRPGAKADCCLILEGAQGIRKSTALRTLAGEYFTDELADLGSKDAAMQTRGVWIIELSELDGLSNSDVARIKAFMSRTTDRFRPPYGMRLMESPRQCVFAGTVNQSAYLRDETGGRRFWPVAGGRIDIEALARDRDQLWAETKGRFDAGAVWWLETNELAQMASNQQMERYEGDPWEEVISPWLEARSSVLISEVLEKCLQKAQALWTQTDKNRAARCLKALGVGAISRAARRAIGVALSEGEVTSCSQCVPGLFPVRCHARH